MTKMIRTFPFINKNIKLLYSIKKNNRLCAPSATQMLEYSVEISNYIEFPEKSDLF